MEIQAIQQFRYIWIIVNYMYFGENYKLYIEMRCHQSHGLLTWLDTR